MKNYLIGSLKIRLEKIKNFYYGKDKVYKYTDLLNGGSEVEINKLEDLPCEFFLLLGDKNLVSKSKNSLLPEVQEFIFEANKCFEFFTGDHLHPVPNKKGHDCDEYNPTLGYYALKRSGSLWLKKSGDVRIAYIQHLIDELSEFKRDDEVKTYSIHKEGKATVISLD